VPDYRRAKSLLKKGDATYTTMVKALRRATASSKLERVEREKTWKGKFDSSPALSTAADEPEPEPEPEPAGESFVAAESWEGAKAGYEFKLGEIGLGYYRTKAAHARASTATGTSDSGKAAAKTKAVRPALKTSGVMAERGAALKKNLLEKMEVSMHNEVSRWMHGDLSAGWVASAFVVELSMPYRY
jgi:hypothetical protein